MVVPEVSDIVADVENVDVAVEVGFMVDPVVAVEVVVVILVVVESVGVVFFVVVGTDETGVEVLVDVRKGYWTRSRYPGV